MAAVVPAPQAEPPPAALSLPGAGAPAARVLSPEEFATVTTLAQNLLKNGDIATAPAPGTFKNVDTMSNRRSARSTTSFDHDDGLKHAVSPTSGAAMAARADAIEAAVHKERQRTASVLAGVLARWPDEAVIRYVIGEVARQLLRGR